MKTPKPKLYFDLTTLRQNRSSSLQANGVTRTLYETAKRFFQDDIQVTFICHDVRKNEYVSVKAEALFASDELDPTHLPNLLGAPVKKIPLGKVQEAQVQRPVSQDKACVAVQSKTECRRL